LSQVHQPECGDPLKVAIYQNYPSKTDQSQFEGYSPALNKHFAVQFYTPEPSQFAAIIQDISERKRSEELQKWLASFPQLNPSPIIEVDSNGTLHYLNPAARRVFPDLQKMGFEHPFLIDIKEMFNLFQSSDSQMVTRDILVGDSYFRQTLSYITETKRVRAYSIDITTRIKAEEALLRARDQLEATVLLRTNELFKSNEQLQIELIERQRLADSLHDAVNQSLFSAGLIAEVLPRLWERDQVEARQSLLDLRQLTGGAQAELRALLTELRPSVISTNNLGYLFEQLTNAFTGRTNIPIELKISGDVAFPANVQVVFYRVCQEALNNISKHAQAKHVVVQFKNKAGILKLMIEDDGRGFNPDSPVTGHYGLCMMIERAESIGAIIAIKSQPGKGTQVNLQWKEAQIEEFK
jgi:signal transduction histidine kinase